MLRNVYAVTPDETSWVVCAPGGIIFSTHPDKEEAIHAAKILAYSDQPSQVNVRTDLGGWMPAFKYGKLPQPEKL